MPHWSYITEPFSLAVKYAPRSRLPPVQVHWGEIHRGYNKDNWPRVCHVSGTKYRWNSISNKIHHPHLICKNPLLPLQLQTLRRAPWQHCYAWDRLGRDVLVSTPCVLWWGEVLWYYRDFENYVSILDADLQNLAVFTLSEIKKSDSITLEWPSARIFRLDAP